MNKTARNFVAAIIALFLVAMMALVASSMMREKAPNKSTLAHTLESAPHNLSVLGLVPSDVYGENYGGIFIVCPGTEQKQLEEVGLDSSQFSFTDGKVAAGKNYAVALGQSAPFVEELDRSEVDLCGGQQLPAPVSANQIFPFVRGEGGAWALGV